MLTARRSRFAGGGGAFGLQVDFEIGKHREHPIINRPVAVEGSSSP
ncbi:hypothetical protein GS944_18205 [Rhodococcus hoagii]|nr:hypothetical protein [Prescottella equi]